MTHLKFVEKAVALTLLGEGKKQKEIADRFKVHVCTIKRLVKSAKNLRPGELAPKRKHSGAINQKKLTLFKLRKLKNIIQKKPFASARQIKQISLHLFENISVRTIQMGLKDNLGLHSRRPTKIPLLTDAHIEKRLKFARSHLNKSKAWWRDVMYSD